MKHFLYVFAVIVFYSINIFALDFDRDGKADLAVFRPENKTWYGMSSRTNSFFSAQWGLETDVLVPADYDGDGLTDLAVWRPENGFWYILQSGDSKFTAVKWGTRSPILFNGFSPDIPVPADYDGDGKADLAVWRPLTGTWYVLESTKGYDQANAVFFKNGTESDVPLPADYDGDGKADFALWNSTNERWSIHESKSQNSKTIEFGQAGDDLLIPSDYTGDGKADIAIFRNGSWLIRRSEDGSVSFYNFGYPTDTPVPADYDGDGKTDIAVFRSGSWFIVNSSNSQFEVKNFGTNVDVPLTENNAKPSIVAIQ